MNVTYDINSPRSLNLGQQYDHNVRTVTFTGFTPVDTTNTIYLKYEGLGLYPLADMTFQVSQIFTSKEGMFNGQLYELASDNTLVQNSKIFKMMVKPSLTEEAELVVNDPSIDLWFNEMSDLYNEVLEAYEGGMLVNPENIERALGYMPANPADIPTKTSELENDSEFITELTDKDIVNALGYTPANNESVPTKTSDLHNDSGFITDLSDDDVINALGYTPANQESVPLNTSELYNDSGFISEIYKNDVIEALGYTPVDEADMDDYLTNITAEDITNSLGYTPASKEEIPIVPEAVSAFENDSGYLTEITSEEIIDALGYIPSNADFGNYKPINTITLSNAATSVVVNTNSEGELFSLDGIAILIRNSSGIQGGTNGYVFAYDADENIVGGRQVFFYGGNNVSQSVIELEIRGDIVEMNSIGWTTSAPYSPSNRSLICDSTRNGKISKVEIIGNGQNIKAGTSITVLGYSLGESAKPDSIVSSSDFELLKEITLATATNSVIVNTDLLSNAFELTGAAVILENSGGIQGGNNGYINMYDSHNNLIGGLQCFFAGGSSVTTSAVKLEIKGDLVEIDSVGWAERSSYAPTNKSLMSELGDAGCITKIEIIGNGYAISAGTTIRVYGVRL